jgi:hypothetical protein
VRGTTPITALVYMVRLHDEVSVRGLSHPPPDHNIPPKEGSAQLGSAPFFGSRGGIGEL